MRSRAAFQIDPALKRSPTVLAEDEARVDTPGATSARGGQILREIDGYFAGFNPCVNNGKHVRL